MVVSVTDPSEIPSDKKVVLDFFARWCGPCKVIGPTYEKLAAEFPDIVFLKVDTDMAHELNDMFSVQILPTFVLLNAGKVVSRVEGAAVTKLIESLKALDSARLG